MKDALIEELVLWLPDGSGFEFINPWGGERMEVRDRSYAAMF